MVPCPVVVDARHRDTNKRPFEQVEAVSDGPFGKPQCQSRPGYAWICQSNYLITMCCEANLLFLLELTY